MSPSSTERPSLRGKVYDPVFLCTLGAVALALGTSIALRVMIATGPASARAETPSLQENNAYAPNRSSPSKDPRP